MLVAGILLLLYFWMLLADTETVNTALIVADIPAALAGLSFLVALVSYFWTPRQMLVRTAFLSYSLLILTSVLLISSTGYLFSPFIALWMLVALFGPIFGWYGIIFTLAIMGGFLGWLAYGDNLTVDQLTTSLFITITPLIVGVLAWQANRDQEEEEDRTVSELARELRSVAGKSEVVIAAIADGVMALDKNGVIQLINPAAQRLIGWGKEDAIGLDYKSVLKMHNSHDKPIEAVNDPVQQALETNKQVSVDTFSLETAESAKKLLAHITVSPIGSLGNGVIVVFRDITSERSEEREQAEFISTASHEMRTPVASIEGYLGLALNPTTATIDEKAREYITKAQESAQHLGRLFQDLLDVSRADDNRLSNDPRVVDLVPFIGDIVRGLAPKAQEKGLQVHFKPDPILEETDGATADKGERTLQPVFYVNVDNDHLREVASNLIENAIKYTLEGSVTVDITGDDTHAVLSVADSGIGIPQEDLSHLFQKFYRVDNTETREIGGTGLGLYLSRKLTEAMKGKIWAESTYQQGSTFYVQLPRVDHVEAKRLIEQAEHAAKAQQNRPLISEVKVAPTPLGEPSPVTPAPTPAAQPAVTTPPAPAPATQPSSPTAPPAPAVGNSAFERPSIDSMSPAARQPVATPQPTATPVPQPAPAPAPVAPTYQPAPPAPQQPVPPAPQQPTAPQSPPSAQPTTRSAPVFIPGQNRANTPIETIEQNPRQYVNQPVAPPPDVPWQF